MLIAIILAASSFPVGAMITNDLPPEILMFLRFLLAAIIFAPFVYIKHGIMPSSKRSFLYYIILSLPLVIFFWCMFESLRYTSVLNTGALYTIVPAITAICALIINREFTGRLRSLGLVIGTIGALWIVFRGNLDSFLGLRLNYGDFIFFVGSIFLGLYNPLVKRFYRGEPMMLMTFWILLFGSIWLLIASAKNILYVNWSNVEQNVYIGIVYLSLFSTLITFMVINLSTIRIGPTKVAAYGFLTPVIVIVLSVLLGLEPFQWITLPGLVLIMLAMIIIQKENVNTTVKSS
jgi:drug/metabolite transporter (DMT)-like permease